MPLPTGINPKIEIPVILHPERAGNPYKWHPIHLDNDSIAFPKDDSSGKTYLFTFNGEAYFAGIITPDMTLSAFRTLPFTHWFTKPLDPDCRIINHDRPLVMEDGVDYLVGIHARLQFVNTETILRDHLPISVWYDDKDLFPIR